MFEVKVHNCNFNLSFALIIRQRDLIHAFAVLITNFFAVSLEMYKEAKSSFKEVLASFLRGSDNVSIV